MNIDTIKNGYVIDHITAGNAIKIYRLLNLESLGCQVALITNVKSKKTGTKDLLKIGELIDINMDKIGYEQLPKEGWAFKMDPNNEGYVDGWYKSDYDTSNWAKIKIFLNL